MNTKVKERPIIMSAPMILKLLKGAKTQTRRIIKPQPEFPTPADRKVSITDVFLSYEAIVNTLLIECPYGKVGDVLWVREGWATVKIFNKKTGEFLREDVIYRAENPNYETDWESPIYMPKEYSRFKLEIARIKVAQVESCSYEDAIAEGFYSYAEFIDFFNKLNPKYLNQNPWVYAIKFIPKKSPAVISYETNN